MRFLLLLMALLVAASIQNTASAKTGETYISSAYLYEVCRLDEQGQEVVPNGSVTCQSYIAGVIDYHNMLQSLGTSPNVDVCVPKQAKLKDLQEIVWRYLEKNTQHQAFVAAPAVTLALYEIFPCPKAKKRK